MLMRKAAVVGSGRTELNRSDDLHHELGGYVALVPGPRAPLNPGARLGQVHGCKLGSRLAD